MLTHLPDRLPSRLALKVKPAAERAVRQGHPWIFADAIVKQNKEGQAGDLAVIFDQKNNQFLAAGLYDPASPIRVKVLQFHAPAPIDAAWFRTKIEAAFHLRAPLLATDTNSYRLVFGENDGLPGLIADVYAGVMVVKLYSLIWLPYLREVLPILLAAGACETLVLRLSRSLQHDPAALHGLYDGQVLYGDLENEEVIFREHGLRFIANVVRGHKTGYFLDHRHNRKRVGELARGKTVLDVFAYAGGFTVHALAGGAREVTSLDISAQALAMARRNVALNCGEAVHHHTLAVDAFKGMEQLHREGKTFDIVVVDPPSFAKRESERLGALRSYERLTALAAPLPAPGGLLVMASCSSRVPADAFFQTVRETLDRSGRPFTEIARTFHDVDHPVGFPEGGYLKCGYFRILD